MQPLISVKAGSQKFQNISETAPSPILSISNYCFSLLFLKFFGVGGSGGPSLTPFSQIWL